MGVVVDIIPGPWDGEAGLELLLYDVLYRDFGVGFDGAWRHEGPGGTLLVARDERGRLVGTARLLPAEGDARQLRQLAVALACRRQGVGRLLVDKAEDVARETGTKAVVLKAREEAFPFYLSLGYEFDGEAFVSELTRIPHRPMRKKLAEHA